VLKAADLVVAAGGFGLVAVDLGEGRTRIPSAAWNRLKHAAERQQTAVLVATPWRTVGAFAAAAITLRAERVRFHRHHPSVAKGDGVSSTSADSDAIASPSPALLAALETTAQRDRGGDFHGPGKEETSCASLVFSSPS
jgi:hypothetical protein